MSNGYVTTATNKLRKLNIYCCITCGKEKDDFSKEWEYAQCQVCSMKEGEDEDKGECTRCWRDVPESELVTFGDWRLCEVCQDDVQ